MSSLLNKVTSPLRGGGCGSTKTIPTTELALQSDIQDIENFITRFDSFVQTIYTKAAVAANQSEAQEIMIAIQWFIIQEENIYKLIKNAQKVVKSYNLIIAGIRKLLESCLIYVRTDSFKCLFILKTTASLSKVIFFFHIKNEKRQLNCNTKNQFLDICDELRQQMEIEKNDLIQNQLELYLLLTKTSFQMAPNDSKERDDILKGFLNGIFYSIIDMKPNAELLIQLFRGACMLYNKYANQKNRKQYEIYFSIDMLQWEIINNFKNDGEKNLEEILLQIEEIHEKIVKNSRNWENHFLWIQMIGKILIYNPLITKKKLKQLTNSFNLEEKSMYIWKEYLNKGFLIQMNHSDDQALILLNQFTNKQLTQIDKLILEDTFKEWENLMVLKDFLLNEKNDNIHFTFGSYLNFQLGSMEPKKNEQIQAICKLQQFFDFIISNKLLALIQENDERLGVIVRNYKNFHKENNYFNYKIEQATYNSQLKKMVFNFKEYFQNTLKIMKIIRLSQRKQTFQIEQLEKINEFKSFKYLKYIMKLIEQILSQAIQDIKNKRNEPDEIIVLQQEIELIQDEVKILTQTDKQFSFVHEFKQRLLALPNATLNQKLFLKEAQCMLTLIQQTEKHVSELEIFFLQKDNLIQYFQCLLNNLNFYYEDQIKELQKYFIECIEILKAIIILQYEIESASKTEKLKEIKQEYSYKLPFKCIQKQRLNNLKLKFKLIAFKECFQNIITIQSEEFQQLQNVINFNEFLLDVLCTSKNNFGEFQFFHNLKYRFQCQNVPISKNILMHRRVILMMINKKNQSKDRVISGFMLDVSLKIPTIIQLIIAPIVSMILLYNPISKFALDSFLRIFSSTCNGQ